MDNSSLFNSYFNEIVILEDHPDKRKYYCITYPSFRSFIKSLPEDERLQKQVLQSIWGKTFGNLTKSQKKHINELTYEDLPSSDQCKWCWMLNNYCTCTVTKKSTLSLPFNIILLMNYKEYRRASNTVKIISKTLTNDSCSTLLYPYKEHLDILNNIINQSNNNIYILFPSEKAVSSYDIAKMIDNTTDNIKDNNNNKITIIVLDGTWREARRMRNHPLLCNIPEIQISMDTINNYESKFIARQKSDVTERISTLEAVALLLQEINENRVHKDKDNLSSEIVNKELLLYNLDIVMKQVLVQGGLKEKTNLKRRQKIYDYFY